MCMISGRFMKCFLHFVSVKYFHCHYLNSQTFLCNSLMIFSTPLYSIHLPSLPPSNRDLKSVSAIMLNAMCQPSFSHNTEVHLSGTDYGTAYGLIRTRELENEKEGCAFEHHIFFFGRVGD